MSHKQKSHEKPFFERQSKTLSLWLIVAMLALAACVNPSGESAPVVVDSETGAATDVGAESVAGQTRTVVHAMGTTEVPIAPQRVVVLDTGEIDNALALGATLVGAPVEDIRFYQPYLQDQLAGVADTGTISEPNLESILALQPDLILGSRQRYEAIYEQLAQIAPTVFTESLRVPWQTNFRLHAEALGKSPEADRLLARYDAAIAQLQEALGDNLDQTTISVIRFRPGQVRLYLKSSYIGYILQDIGLPRPASQDEDSFSAEISLEQVADIDADYIFITGYSQEDSDLATFMQSPLWTTLGAVQNEQAIPVDDAGWIAGLGIQAAHLVLEDLASYLVPGGLVLAQASESGPAYPVTIAHKYGATTLTERPQRVVTVGLTDHDALLALGVVPVGTTEWFGGHPGSIHPWAQSYLNGQMPEPVGESGAISFEKIVALQPDLILALYSGISENEYELLSQIAPTVAQPGEYVDWGIPWQEITLTVGKVLGELDQAEALITAIEERFAQVQTEHPQFVGAEALVATTYNGIWVYGPEDVRGRFLSSLGFVIPAWVTEVSGASFGGSISLENTPLIDIDLLIWLSGPENVIEVGGPVYQNLAVHQAGREVFLADSIDPTLTSATSFVTVLSLHYLIDELTPMLAAALGEE